MSSTGYARGSYILEPWSLAGAVLAHHGSEQRRITPPCDVTQLRWVGSVPSWESAVPVSCANSIARIFSYDRTQCQAAEVTGECKLPVRATDRSGQPQALDEALEKVGRHRLHTITAQLAA